MVDPAEATESSPVGDAESASALTASAVDPGTFTPQGERDSRKGFKSFTPWWLVVAAGLWLTKPFVGVKTWIEEVSVALAWICVWCGSGYVSQRRYYRRRKIWRMPFPEEGRKYLEEVEPFYQSLSPERRERFIQGMKVFLDEIPLNGVGPEVDDTLRWHVAASAVMVFFGLPECDWRALGLREVILVPEVIKDGSREDDGIVTEYEESGFIGTEGLLNGVVTLVVPDLVEDAEHPEDGVQVAVHEFAHLYDAAGLAAHVDAGRWAACVKEEWRRVERGDSLFDDYALTDEHELFALGTEYFFTHPRRLRRNHPSFYRLLVDAYHMDPVSDWPADLTDAPDRIARRRRGRRGRGRGLRRGRGTR